MYLVVICFQACCEKAQTIPAQLNASILPQLKALENVIEYIFNRNACLLPGYFIVNEIQKGYPDNKTWPHWVNILVNGFFLNFHFFIFLNNFKVN